MNERSAKKESGPAGPIHLKSLKKIITIMNRAQLTELDVEQDGVKIHLRKGPLADLISQVAAAAPAAPAAVPAAPAAPPAALPAPPAEDANLYTITSPMVGTFYRAAAPDAAPYVTEGSVVEEGTVVCIVEAMKLMNEIKAEAKGTIRRIMVDNAQAVEFGQPLFQLERKA